MTSSAQIPDIFSNKDFSSDLFELAPKLPKNSKPFVLPNESGKQTPKKESLQRVDNTAKSQPNEFQNSDKLDKSQTQDKEVARQTTNTEDRNSDNQDNQPQSVTLIPLLPEVTLASKNQSILSIETLTHNPPILREDCIESETIDESTLHENLVTNQGIERPILADNENITGEPGKIELTKHEEYQDIDLNMSTDQQESEKDEITTQVLKSQPILEDKDSNPGTQITKEQKTTQTNTTTDQTKIVANENAHQQQNKLTTEVAHDDDSTKPLTTATKSKDETLTANTEETKKPDSVDPNNPKILKPKEIDSLDPQQRTRIKYHAQAIRSGAIPLSASVLQENFLTNTPSSSSILSAEETLSHRSSKTPQAQTSSPEQHPIQNLNQAYSTKHASIRSDIAASTQGSTNSHFSNEAQTSTSQPGSTHSISHQQNQTFQYNQQVAQNIHENRIRERVMEDFKNQLTVERSATNSGASLNTLQAVTKSTETSQAQTATELIPAIMEHLERLQKSEKSSMKVALDLPNGEKLSLNLKMQNSRVSVDIDTDFEEIKETLSRDWNKLIQQASSQGIQLAQLSFNGLEHRSSSAPSNGISTQLSQFA